LRRGNPRRARLARMRPALVLAIAVLALAASSPAPVRSADAPIVREGVHENAPFRYEVPAQWNGGLVMFAHGYQGEGPGAGSVVTEPLDALLSERGYAWAATGYRSIGYRPDWFMDDVRALRELFVREVGRPRWTILHGQSMGGHVTIASLELHPGLYQGALIECGIIDGIGLADYLYAYTAAAEYIGGVPLLDAPDRQTFHRRVNEQWVPAVGTPGAYTERGRRFESVVKHLMGDPPLWREGLPRRYLMNLVYLEPGDPRQVLRRAVSTQHVRYRVDPGLGVDEAELNTRVRRIAPEPGFRSRVKDAVYAELTGRITAPVMAIHETGDSRVPFVLQQQYRRRTLAAGTSDLLVQRAVRWPGHCAFDSDIRDQAFDDLVAWIERGVKPAGDDVLTADRATLGRRWTPRPHPADH
jgi:pimeloyl-ACP methyl ester carboxylesterase